MRITTKRGDGGETDIFGKRVKKTDPLIKLIGKLDTCIAFTGWSKSEVKEVYYELDRIQEWLKYILNNLSYGNDIEKNRVELIDKELEIWEMKIKQLKGFVKPKGKSSFLHILRAIIREAEIIAWESNFKNTAIFLNRLSDYVFLLSIYVSDLLQETEYFIT